MKQLKHNTIAKDAFRVSVVVFTAALYSLALIWFLEPAHIYSAGVTGFAQLFVKMLENTPLSKVPLGVYTLLLNIPIILYGWKKVSIRFAIYSILSVAVQAILTLGYIPVVNFGIDPVKDTLTFAIIGGVLTGISCGVALRYGTSTGGLDVLAQVLSIQKNMSIGYITLIVNTSIAATGSLLAMDATIVIYSSIRILLTSVVIDKIHTSYNYMKINIISTKKTELIERLKELGRGCTIIQAEGSYTKEIKYNLVIVVSSHEMNKIISICRELDPVVFIYVEPVKNIYGNYKKKSIA